jgi:arylsulfatase
MVPRSSLRSPVMVIVTGTMTVAFLIVCSSSTLSTICGVIHNELSLFIRDQVPYPYEYFYYQSQTSTTGADKQAKSQSKPILPPPSKTETKTTTNPNPLNIVLLYGDDWRHDSLGVAGSVTRTPFLDRLAQEGIRFTHNCVTTSICWISRATLHTGQYFARHQAVLPNSTSWYSDWNTSTFPGLLKGGGGRYVVGHVGKWQFLNFTTIQSHYDFARIYSGQHWYFSTSSDDGDTIKKKRMRAERTPLHAIDRNQRDALDFLRQRPKDKPFMLTVAFFPPHAVDGTKGQYFPQPKTIHLYVNTTLDVPMDMNASFARLPSFFDEDNEGRVRWHARFDEPTKYQVMLKNYYRLISGVDAACQAIVDELHRQGIWNDTMVIFTTDNGLYHGEHGLAGKWYPHQESLRTPLLIKDPRMPRHKWGTVDDSLTLNVDLAPTILGAAQVPWQAGRMQGRDIADLYRVSHIDEPATPWRTEFFYEHPTLFGEKTIPGSSALVRKDMKYVLWSDFAQEQLFSLTQDPKEEMDLSSDGQYALILDAMRARHKELQKWVK